MGKSWIIVPHMYLDGKVLTGAILPLGWRNFAATVVFFTARVVLKLRASGASSL